MNEDLVRRLREEYHRLAPSCPELTMRLRMATKAIYAVFPECQTVNTEESFVGDTGSAIADIEGTGRVTFDGSNEGWTIVADGYVV